MSSAAGFLADILERQLLIINRQIEQTSANKFAREINQLRLLAAIETGKT
jgi:hypothetical protein